MPILGPLPGAYTSTAFDVLNPDIVKVVEYVVELDQLTKAIPVVRAELKNLRDVAPASNDDILAALVESVGESKRLSDDLRLERLRPIVERFADSFRHQGYPRASVQAGVTPELRSVYVTAAVDQLRNDFGKLKRTDTSIAHQAKIRDAEVQLKKLEQRSADHSAFCLTACFKDSRLPHSFRGNQRPGMITQFGLFANSNDIAIGMKILSDFSKSWKAVAAVCPEPVSVHGTAISSMQPERRKSWSKAFEKFGLKPGTSNNQFHPRSEPRSPGDKSWRANTWQRA